MTDLVVATPRGLYCAAGDFHIDPWQPVPRAFITHAHGDHVHIGPAVVSARDASGLRNPSALNTLLRKGLLRVGPSGLPVLTPEGLAYDTGSAAEILRRADH